MSTIRGITFYEQEETPGLGGEIVTEGFRKGFVGKRIHDKEDNVGIVIGKPGSAQEQNEIDGISGATMTCEKVQAMLNEAIESIFKGKQ
jgi:Na+-transporting NADH:ubiquinone oxidoreductase subunit C